MYVTVNIFAHESDMADLPAYLKFLDSIGVDAVIASDPGIISLIREHTNLAIHLSTQANVLSARSAQFWSQFGIKRIILARELNQADIAAIVQANPNLELEIFVHGALCISYSGRCMLSSFLNQRSANQGLCTHPCRWEYSLVEKSRPGQHFEIQEDERGTYILNSKDLCLINRLPDILALGLSSVKIEGRMKSLYYVANVTRVYKQALLCLQNNLPLPANLLDELDKISHRPYTEGFFASLPTAEMQTPHKTEYERSYQFIGKVLESDETGFVIECGSKFSLGDTLEIIFPDLADDISLPVTQILDEEGHAVTFSKPNQKFRLPYPGAIPGFGIVRMQQKMTV
jgi:putative protease